jgi:hypothetical protein
MEKGIRTRLIDDSSTRELREFGLIVAAGFAGILGTLLPLLRHRALPLWPWAMALLLVLFVLLAPRLLYYPRQLWQSLGKGLGWVNSQIILTLLFYLVFFPAGVLARAFGWDPMERQFEPRRTSYRQSSMRPARESMERPY